MAYTVYKRKAIRAVTPAVRISPLGVIVLNAAVVRLFRENRTGWVLLLSDLDERDIGIRPLKKKEKDSFRVAYGNAQAAVSAGNFLRSLGWDGKQYKSQARWDEKESLLGFKIPEWPEVRKAAFLTADDRNPQKKVG